MLASKPKIKKPHKLSFHVDRETFNQLKEIPNFSEFARESIELNLKRLQQADRVA